MAFSWAGDLTGAYPVIKKLPISTTSYQGQLLQWDEDSGGAVELLGAATASPEATLFIAGICSGIVGSPTYDGTHKGDMGTYDESQALQLANDPRGPVLAEVTLVTPTTLIRGPIVHDTIGTALSVLTNTATSSDGSTITFASSHTTEDNFSTAYCRTGLNKGLYRKITSASATAPTVTICFPYDIEIGDTFVIPHIKEGFATIEFDTQKQGIAAYDNLTHAFYVYVHELNLEEAGKEYAIFSFSTRHLL
jgi:hypothetical protein